MNKPQYLEAPNPTDVAACNWQQGQSFRVMKMDVSDLHSAWHVVMPGGSILSFNNCADDAQDEAQANWVANALNAALTPSPAPSAAPQEADALREALAAMTADRDRLDALVNSPETRNFLEGVRNEVAHQVERWGTVHDRAKEPADWFWLVGYLGGKALAAHVKGDTEKAMHHCISTSAALANWHAHIAHGAGLMQPGSSDLQDFLRETFGANFIEGQEARAALAQQQAPQQGEQQ